MTGREDTAKNGTKKQKTWREILIDSAIIGLVVGASLLGDKPPTLVDLWIPFRSAFYAFILQVAVERGLKRATTPE